MIQCIKIAAYQLRSHNLEEYDYLRDVGLQNIDPPSLAPRSIIPNSAFIYCSSLRRATESVRIGPDQKFIKTGLLKEIPFDLADLCSKQEWILYRSKIVRKRFRESFISDILPFSQKDIFKDLKNILTCVRENNRNIAFISHSFRLKILQAYVKTGGDLEHKPELINEFLFDEQKTFDFGEGFIISDAELFALDDSVCDLTK